MAYFYLIKIYGRFAAKTRQVKNVSLAEKWKLINISNLNVYLAIYKYTL